MLIFFTRSLLYGHPPKFIYLRIGNSPTSKIVQILRDNFDTIALILAERIRKHLGIGLVLIGAIAHFLLT